MLLTSVVVSIDEDCSVELTGSTTKSGKNNMFTDATLLVKAAQEIGFLVLVSQ